jgi:hypothetical protein
MAVDNTEKFKTIFGPEFEVTVYNEPSQYKGKISMLVHPDDIKTVKEIINGATYGGKENDAFNKT